MHTEIEDSENLKAFKKYQGEIISDSPSPYMNWLKPKLLNASKGSLECAYEIRLEMTNPYGVLHGGITAGIIDDLIGATVYTLGLQARYTTVNNYIDYFAPAKMGDTIVAKTKIEKQGRQIINVSCEVILIGKNRLIAKGYSNMMNIGQANTR
ncbi:MAG: PaaI family thioesterase [Pedobacter sp.]|nr:MAG: PaaI family thioesterase [Pedobacter sp.]